MKLIAAFFLGFALLCMVAAMAAPGAGREKIDTFIYAAAMMWAIYALSEVVTS